MWRTAAVFRKRVGFLRYNWPDSCSKVLKEENEHHVMQPEIATADPSLRRGDTTEETLGRVLLVDDGDTNRMIAAAMLRAGWICC